MSWHGTFCWYELMADDADAAQAFYGDVVGWGCEPSGMPGMDYRLFLAGGERAAGLMPVIEGGPRPSWTGYVAVDDCDAAAAKAQELGGAVHRAPADIPGVGRFAVLGDPQGAALAILAPLPSDAPAPDPATPGRCGWHELHTSDMAAAWRFYEALFGWEKGEAMPMPGGTYQIFRAGGASRDTGAMLTNPQAPHPYWNFYFTVPALDAATGRVTAGGGKVLHGPMEVPGAMWIAMCVDPQGAPFSLLSGTR